MPSKKKIGGVVLVGAGFLLNETLGWGIGQMLTYATKAFSLSAVSAWPWGSLIAILLVVAGIIIVFWPEKSPSLPRILVIAADRALARITVAAQRPYWNATSPDFSDANTVGESALVTFKKAGFKVPILSDEPVQKAVQIKSYFDALLPLVRDGHIKEAKAKAKVLVSKVEK